MSGSDITKSPASDETPGSRAVATAGGESSIAAQREQVCGWAEKHGLPIEREFVDAGNSVAEECPGSADTV
jgi:hypothetical protein